MFHFRGLLFKGFYSHYSLAPNFPSFKGKFSPVDLSIPLRYSILCGRRSAQILPHNEMKLSHTYRSLMGYTIEDSLCQHDVRKVVTGFSP